jgi:cobalt/nickel transport system permease protein
MRVWLDEYAHLDSPLHRWEPRLKLVGLLALIFAFAFVRELLLLPAMLAVALALLLLSRLPGRFVLQRLRYPGIFILLLAGILPLFSGETVLLSAGPLALREEGLLEFAVIASRFAGIITLGIVLFGTTPILTNVKALRSLGLPALLADMMLFTYRYLHELADDLRAMRTAMRLRGFRAARPDAKSLGGLAALSGSLLVRSYEQSEHVYRAMVLRGYGRASGPREEQPVGPRDVIALALALAVGAAFVALEFAL